MIFLIYFLTTIGPVHHTYNIQLTKKYFNEIILFQNSPVQPLAQGEGWGIWRPWWVVSILGMTPGEMMWVGRRGRGLSSSSSRESIDSSLDLCTIVFAVKQSKNSEKWLFYSEKITKSQKIAQVTALRLVILLQGISICLPKKFADQ